MTRELEAKLAATRAQLRESGCSAARLRGVDWFSWATAGGAGEMLLSAETGIAEVLVTAHGAWVLTDVIEAERLRAEQVPAGYEILATPWQEPERRERLVSERAAGGRVASDRLGPGETALPPGLVQARRRLLPEEIERYAALGQEAAEAISEALAAARPEWTEWELAARGAYALKKRGIDPALIQVGGEERLPRFRHLLPSRARIGRRALMACCARRHGLVASLSRFVHFARPSAQELADQDAVARIEAAALDASRPGARLGAVYERLVAAYRETGHEAAIHEHHQGGTTGYLARELLARPGCDVPIDAGTALAWNPSLPGMKIEDTFVCTEQGVRLLTRDPAWPTFERDGRLRPAPLLRA